jgi:hypothetical protein
MRRLDRIRYFNDIPPESSDAKLNLRLPVKLAQTGRRITLDHTSYAKEIKWLKITIKHIPALLKLSMEMSTKGPPHTRVEPKQDALKQAAKVFELLKKEFPI